jgi:hypothetical protein
LQKIGAVPMSFAVVLTTDTDFRICRRHSRLTIPCVMPD